MHTISNYLIEKFITLIGKNLTSGLINSFSSSSVNSHYQALNMMLPCK